MSFGEDPELLPAYRPSTRAVVLQYQQQFETGAKLGQAQQEQLRKLVDGEKIISRLLGLVEEAHDAGQIIPRGELEQENVKIRLASIDIQSKNLFKLLNKVLPDLKSVQIDDKRETEHRTRQDLNDNIQRLLAAARARHPGAARIAEPQGATPAAGAAAGAAET